MASGQRGSVAGQQQQQQLVVHSSSAAGGTTTAAAVLFALHWRPALRPAQYRAAASASAQPKGSSCMGRFPTHQSQRGQQQEQRQRGSGGGQVHQCECPFSREPAWELMVVVDAHTGV